MGFVQGDFSASIYVLANPFLKWEKLKIFEFLKESTMAIKDVWVGELVRGAPNVQRRQLKGTGKGTEACCPEAGEEEKHCLIREVEGDRGRRGTTKGPHPHVERKELQKIDR